MFDDDDLDALLWQRELAGFKRRERLDVKKPGPLFSTNNYAFKTQSPPGEQSTLLLYVNSCLISAPQSTCSLLRKVKFLINTPKDQINYLI